MRDEAEKSRGVMERGVHTGEGLQWECCGCGEDSEEQGGRRRRYEKDGKNCNLCYTFIPWWAPFVPEYLN